MDILPAHPSAAPLIDSSSMPIARSCLCFSLILVLLFFFIIYEFLCCAFCSAIWNENSCRHCICVYMESYILKMLFVELMNSSWKWRMKHLKFVLIIYSTRCTQLYAVCFNFYLGSLSLDKTVAKSNLMRCAHDDDVVAVVVDDER